MKPPRAEKVPKSLEIHGHKRIDEYYWLNERENPKVIDYLNQENSFLKSELAHTEELQEELFLEMKSRIKEDDQSVPFELNDYWYYTRYEEGKEYPYYCRKLGSLEAQEEIILDVNEMAEGQAFCNVKGISIHPNNQLMAFGVDFVGRRQYEIKIKSLQTSNILEDSIENTTGGSVWSQAEDQLFYTERDETLRSARVMRHELGTSSKDDVLVYEEEDETFDVSVGKSKSKKYLVISSHSTLSSEFQLLESSNPKGEWRIFQERERDHEYSIDHFEDAFFIITNWKAKNFRLMKSGLWETSKEHWEEVLAHRDDVMIEDLEIFRDYMVLEERYKGISQMRVFNQKDKSEHYIQFPEEAYTAGTSVNLVFDTKILRLVYSSMTTPATVFDYDLDTRAFTLLKEQEVLGGFNKEDYRSERLNAIVRDGVEVPISLVYKKGFKVDGKSPLLLYAYGSYGHSLDPYFSSSRLSLLDRGFAFAIPHIRGGEEMGRDWYENGKLLKKKNTFNDFVDCAEFLLEQKYVKPNSLFAAGGSAGGLLMGAVMNMRPDLWAGVLAAVPFVDVVTTMLDESIPLTTGEYDEWGNPNNKEYYDYIFSYSPYDQVKEMDYPNVLVTTGLHDSQVQYWEPAKWVARLRDKNTSKNQILLHTNMDTGHGGASGRFEYLKEIALEYAFLLDIAKRTK
ncbi:S9 family peptidase [Salibacteraceae bacterium]|nr:S9 family peptidase [Salibacteraceae bacterium]